MFDVATLPKRENAHYPGIDIVFDDEKHRYEVNGEKFPSVTTIVGKHYSKDAIAHWVERKTLEGVCQMQKWVDAGDSPSLPRDVETFRAALYAEGLTADQEKERKGAIGCETHGAFEGYIKTGRIPKLGELENQEAREYVAAVGRALLEIDATFPVSEVLVASLRHKYAGRFDAVMEVQTRSEVNFAVTQDGRIERRYLEVGRYLIDLKTANNIYPEVGMQLAGYAQAAYECGFGTFKGLLAFHLQEHGDYAVHQFKHQRGDFAALAKLYHRHLAAAKRRTRANKALEAA